MTLALCEIIAELASKQEQADPKLLLHCYHVLSVHPLKNVIIRWYNKDNTDIVVIKLNTLLDQQDRVYLDNGIECTTNYFSLLISTCLIH